MPTGYTAELDDKKMDTHDWVLGSLVRAFGICVMFREEGHMSQEELEKKLRTNAQKCSYAKKKLASLKHTLRIYEHRSDVVWKREMDKENERRKKSNDDERKKVAAMKKRHLKTVKDLTELRDEATSDVTKEIAKFGIEQLDRVKSEWKRPYIQSMLTSIDSYKQEMIADTTQMISSYEKEVEGEKDRSVDRYHSYMKVKLDVEKILGGTKNAKSNTC